MDRGLVGNEPEAFPKTLCYCHICKDDTPHQIQSCGIGLTKICLKCWERAMNYELNRE